MEDFDPNHRDAIELLTKGKSIEAEEKLREILEKDPANVSVMCDIGYALEKQGRPMDAEDIYRTVTELFATYQQGWYKLGGVLAYQRKFHEATVAFKRAIELLPDYSFSWEGLAYSLWKDGQISKSIDAFRKAIELTPDPYNSMSPIYLAEVLFEQGEFEDSEKVLRPIVEDKRNEGFAELWLLWGNLLVKLNKDEEAKEAFQKAKDMNKE